jgi:hypothetical protein
MVYLPGPICQIPKVPGMPKMRFGRKKYSLKKGKPILESTSVTVRTLPREDEEAFTKRLIELYGHREGTVEMVFKAGRPDYAVITFSEQARDGISPSGDSDSIE